MPGTFRVPERRPFSWPPPSIWQASSSFGFRFRTKSAPAPSGRSTCAPSARAGRCSSRGRRSAPSPPPGPHRCGRSRRGRWRSRRSRPAAGPCRSRCWPPSPRQHGVGRDRGAQLVEIDEAFAIDAEPVTRQPRSPSRLNESSTDLCSVTTVIRCIPRSRERLRRPLIARLFDSVAPLVKTISFERAPMSAATCSRAASTASAPPSPRRAACWRDCRSAR